MTIQNAALMSAEEFAQLDDVESAELVRGRVVRLTKPKPKHGRIAMRIGAAVATFVEKHKLGEVFAAETGFIAGRDPDSVRAPDVAFVRAEVVAGHDEDEWYPHSPDLAVEVVSPTDRPRDIEAKVQMWLDFGGRSVWIIDPATQSATVHHNDGSSYKISQNEDLRDDSILPGLSMPLARAFKQS